MSAFRTGVLAAVVAATCGCGDVPDDGMDAGMDAPPVGTTTYRGTLQMAPLAMFGGAPYCNYTVTLSQIELELQFSTTGMITGGSSQALAVEATVAPCAPGGIPPNIHKFTFTSAMPSGSSFAVVLTGAATNAPTSILNLTVTPAAGAFTAVARWSRTGTEAILTWNVISNLTLTVK